VRGALIHRARETGTRPAAVRDAQGQYPAEPYEGPEFRVRFMERGVSGKQRRDDSSARQARTYELLADFVDLAGAPLELESGMRLLVVAVPVTPADGWEVEVDGDPERLNNGVAMIGWMANVTKVEDAA
jgi:hypothetical protein